MTAEITFMLWIFVSIVALLCSVLVYKDVEKNGDDKEMIWAIFVFLGGFLLGFIGLAFVLIMYIILRPSNNNNNN